MSALKRSFLGRRIASRAIAVARARRISVSPSFVTTWAWGDGNATNVVGVDDVLCELDGFSGNFSICSFDAVDLFPCLSNELIDVDDLLGVLGGFCGDSYSCP